MFWAGRPGRPPHHAIVWQDTRTADAGARLAAADPAGVDRFRALTGLPISTYSSALKLAWILDEGGPERRAAAAAGDLLFGRHERLADDAHGRGVAHLGAHAP